MHSELTLAALYRLFDDQRVTRVFMKQLAPNDNSKNQIYLGEELSVLNVLPSAEFTEAKSASVKPGAANKQILKAKLQWMWVDSEGAFHAAPGAQIILYPQYPEVRLSGFLAGSSIKLSHWFQPNKCGRSVGRTLVLGVSGDTIYAYLAPPQSQVQRELAPIPVIARFGALTEIPIRSGDREIEVLNELRRIHLLGWITSKRLDRFKNILPCNSPNCGGYTLEAELGITPNGYSEPDFLGWEVKSFSVPSFARLDSQTITLMTPEPDGGMYQELGVESFMRRFGYADLQGRPDRINFGGRHQFGRQDPRTRLTLTLTEFDVGSGTIKDVNGGVALLHEGECAALWTYRKLIEHWKKKHDKAVYVPNQKNVGDEREYRYGPEVLLGRGTAFEMLLQSIMTGSVYYDPGIKMENASGLSPRIKRRSQFRIRSRDLKSLYGTLSKVSVGK